MATARISLRLRVLDSDFDVDADDPVAAAELTRLLADVVADPPGSPSRPPHRVTLPAGALANALADINTTALTEVDCLAIHAGVLAYGDVTLAVPAASGAGKTTLVTAGLLAGFDYVSDEALCLDWTGADRPLSVVGYARPLGLSPWTAAAVGLGERAGESFVTAADLGAAVRHRPPPPRHVVLLDPPGERPDLRPARPGEAVAELLRRSFTGWRRPELAFGLAHRLAGAASAWRLTPGRPADTAEVLLRLTAGSSR